MRKAHRFRLLVDTRLQGALVVRTLLYWCACVGVMLVLAALQVVWVGGDVEGAVLFGRIAAAFGPALIASLVLLPLVAFDSLRFSNRFAGPLHRLQREVNRLADGEAIRPIVFRDGDFWQNLADPINRLASEITEHRGQSENQGAAEKLDATQPTKASDEESLQTTHV